MPDIEKRLADLNLVLPQPLRVPAGVLLPFPWINIRGNRAFISGHAPQETDGSLAGPFGAVGRDVSLDDAKMLARKVALSVLTSLKIALGDLDRVEGWCRVFGMVNAAPGFDKPPAVINGFSEVILDVFGPEVGAHARSAVGVSALPFNLAVEVEAEVLIRS